MNEIVNWLWEGDSDSEELFDTLEEALKRLDSERTTMCEQRGEYHFDAWKVMRVTYIYDTDDFEDGEEINLEDMEESWDEDDFEEWNAFPVMNVDYAIRENEYISKKDLIKLIDSNACKQDCFDAEKVKADVLNEYKGKLENFRVNGETYYTFSNCDSEIEDWIEKIKEKELENEKTVTPEEERKTINKKYKNFKKVYLGWSDIASLILRSAMSLESLNFGEDGSYSAYFIDKKIELPSHYTKVWERTNDDIGGWDVWLNIYDDVRLRAKIRAKKIEIYRAGQRGCIIFAPGGTIETEFLED